MNNLKSRVAIVTGSASGMGEAIARMLSHREVKVVVNSRSSIEIGKKIAMESDGIYCQVDITKESD
jgi:NAD(P)-dependent dehydrogenase (short-subunit alcohol dehydrogenase family)